MGLLENVSLQAGRLIYLGYENVTSLVNDGYLPYPFMNSFWRFAVSALQSIKQKKCGNFLFILNCNWFVVSDIYKGKYNLSPASIAKDKSPVREIQIHSLIKLS